MSDLPVALPGVGDGLDAGQRRQLAAVLQLLHADEHAPTAIREPERAARLHLADSLAALDLAAIGAAERIADLGSGAGFPGLPLAVALPAAAVDLVESQRRKCDFLQHACAAAEIENARVVCVRAEEWRAGIGRNDVVVVRALAARPVVLEYAAPLLRPGGTLVDWRGRRDALQERAAACAAEQLGLGLVEVRHVEPYPGARDHHLHVYEKTAATPSRFPRRAGVARRRPLGC